MSDMPLIALHGLGSLESFMIWAVYIAMSVFGVYRLANFMLLAAMGYAPSNMNVYRLTTYVISFTGLTLFIMSN